MNDQKGKSIMRNDNSSALPQFGGALTHFSPLSRERELELAKRWQATGDERAADELVKAHLRYVVATASKFRRYGLPLDELVAEGSFGLVHALRKYDAERGTRFVTYAAYWIRAYILNYVLRSWSLVGSGAGALRSKNFFRLRRERAKVANLYHDPSQAEQELAKRMNLPVIQLRRMLERLDARDVSLDAPLYDSHAGTLVDALPSEDQDQETSLFEIRRRELLERTVQAALIELDDRERFIVQSRMMAERGDELSLAEIGRQLGVSRERARQLEVRAKSKLRSLIARLSPAPELLAPSAA
jgi:RNA polymerase sigma-32 factor